MEYFTISRRHIFVFVLGIALVLPMATNGQDDVDCASNVNTCVETAFAIFTNHPDDFGLVCRSTDEFLECVVNETRSCDPLVAASIKESMSPMITMYTGEPYNCELKNAENEALQVDICSEEMSQCSVFYYQATSESERNHNLACSLFEKYLSCMKKNTSMCQGDLRDFINEHSDNATQEFDQAPYYCEERLNYDIDGVDRNMSECDNIMVDLDMRIIKQDYVCGFYRSYFNCAVGVLVGASPRQFELYINAVNQMSYTFRAQPFFCESEEPCMELFRVCNTTAHNNGMPPCELMDVYTSCLSNGLSACAQEDYDEVATSVQQLIGDIHNKHNCIEANKNKPFDDVTDPPLRPTTIEENLNQGGDADVVTGSNEGTDTNGEEGTVEPTGGSEGDGHTDNDDSHGNPVTTHSDDVTTNSGSDNHGNSQSGDTSHGSSENTQTSVDNTGEAAQSNGGTQRNTGSSNTNRQSSRNNNNDSAGSLASLLNWQIVLIGPLMVKLVMT